MADFIDEFGPGAIKALQEKNAKGVAEMLQLR